MTELEYIDCHNQVVIAAIGILSRQLIGDAPDFIELHRLIWAIDNRHVKLVCIDPVEPNRPDVG